MVACEKHKLELSKWVSLGILFHAWRSFSKPCSIGYTREIITLFFRLSSLSATVTIVCLFTPKLYIILLHPEKNIRQSMMNQSKYQQSVQVKTTAQQNGQPAVTQGQKQQTTNGKNPGFFCNFLFLVGLLQLLLHYNWSLATAAPKVCVVEVFVGCDTGNDYCWLFSTKKVASFQRHHCFSCVARNDFTSKSDLKSGVKCTWFSTQNIASFQRPFVFFSCLLPGMILHRWYSRRLPCNYDLI